MGRLTPSFRQLYEEVISDLRTELQGALVDLGHKKAFDLILKDAWNQEQAAMANSTLPTVCDKLNVIASIHNRKLIYSLVKQVKEKDMEIQELENRIIALEDKLDNIQAKVQ
jgi:aminopeptidase-like protein